mmetsp:Transcript_150047/g.482262  ORF Transcript_150047/g.482262 Transcript_150047/m.482262 type:complete len:210 (+) Transcript_150047:1362-1991(+)
MAACISDSASACLSAAPSDQASSPWARSQSGASRTASLMCAVASASLGCPSGISTCAMPRCSEALPGSTSRACRKPSKESVILPSPGTSCWSAHHSIRSIRLDTVAAEAAGRTLNSSEPRQTRTSPGETVKRLWCACSLSTDPRRFTSTSAAPADGSFGASPAGEAGGSTSATMARDSPPLSQPRCGASAESIARWLPGSSSTTLAQRR